MAIFVVHIHMRHVAVYPPGHSTNTTLHSSLLQTLEFSITVINSRLLRKFDVTHILLSCVQRLDGPVNSRECGGTLGRIES